MFDNKWQNYFMKAAVHASSNSKDPSTKCGAVLVNNDKDIVISGYNGFPPNVEDHFMWLNDREFKLTATIHAEMNAILRCPVSTRGLHLFATHHPCSNCTKHVLGAGIASVYWLKNTTGYEERWAYDLNRSKILLQAAKIPFFELDLGANDGYIASP